MTILVDADACPVISIIERVAEEHKIKVMLFCDTCHRLESESSKIITIDKGRDAVDFAVINRGKKEDIVVTQDYGVACMALAKGMYAIHPSGRQFTDNNIEQLMFERHLAKRAREESSHYHGKKTKKRTKEDDVCFERNFRNLIKQLKI